MPDWLMVWVLLLLGVLLGFIGVVALEFLERLFEF